MVTLRQNTSWYSDDLRSAKHHCKKAERKWHSTKLMMHHLLYDKLLHRMSNQGKETILLHKNIRMLKGAKEAL